MNKSTFDNRIKAAYRCLERLQQQNEELITARQNLELDRQRYQELFNFAPESFLVTDLEGIIREANHAAASLLNMPQDFLVGKPLVIFVVEEEHPQFCRQMARLRKVKKHANRIEPFKWRVNLRPNEGAPLFVTISVNVYHDPAGCPSGLCWTLHNISVCEKKMAEIRQVDVELEKLMAERTAQLHEFKEKYQLLVDHIPASIYIAAIDGSSSTLYNNPQIEKMVGYTSDDWMADPELWAKQLHPDDRQRVLKEVAHTQTNGNPLCTEYRMLARDGHTVWVRDEAYIVRDEADKPLSLQGIMFDITERKQAEIALQESNLRLANQQQYITSILESIPISLVVIDRAMRVVSVNSNFLKKTRRDAQATLGHKVEEVFPPALLEYTRLDQRLLEVFHTSQPVEGGKLVYHAPGLPNRTYYYQLIPIYMVPHSPILGKLSKRQKTEETRQVENVMLLMDDVTEREQLSQEVRGVERHLAGIVECTDHLVVSMNSQGVIVAWNKAAEVISGLKFNQVKRQSLVSLCAPAQQSIMESMLASLVRGQNVLQTEINLQTAKGLEVPIAWNCFSICDEAGRVVGLVAVGHDLSDQQRLEDLLVHSDKMASLGVMAGGIAHELRNPLGIISASAQLLMENPEDFHLHNQGLQKIYTATKRASIIIEDLLKFARLEAGRAKKKIYLCDIIDETLELLLNQITLQKVTLSQQYQTDLPPINGNREMLQQVFTNLVLNACNAMPGGGSLMISAQSTTSGEVEISFNDTGCGIKPEHLSKIFDPFFSTMPVGKGIGLGLSVSHSIIKQHNGVIEVQSQVGIGSTFIIRLPGITDK
jgi:PAS domain S-box-containing protein